MPLHPDPTNIAEELARHLEISYALQLDPARHKHLVAELEAFGERFALDACQRWSSVKSSSTDTPLKGWYASNIVLVPHTPGAIADLEKGTEVVPNPGFDDVVNVFDRIFFPEEKSNAK